MLRRSNVNRIVVELAVGRPCHGHGRPAAATSSEVLCVERATRPDRNFGLALDVGTTTVVAHLVDLTSGITREAAAKYNSQIKFGADVISRINYARQPGGAEALHRAIIQDIETLIDDLVERAQVGRGDISCVVAAGNTAMLHFLLALEADLIRISPFVPAATSPPPLRAAEIGLRINPRGILYTLPMVGSYVGGDITAGILASGMHQSRGNRAAVGHRHQRRSGAGQPRFPGGLLGLGGAGLRGRLDLLRHAGHQRRHRQRADLPPGTGRLGHHHRRLPAGRALRHRPDRR